MEWHKKQTLGGAKSRPKKWRPTMQEKNRIYRSEKIMGKMLTHACPANLTSVVEHSYTTHRAEHSSDVGLERSGKVMAFIRRKGNSYYLVHNVRRGGKVRQLYLARLGERARITDAVVREVTKKHPFVELNWRLLREQLNNQIDLADPQSPAVQKLVQSLRNLNLDLADFFPPVLRLSESPAVAQELLVQLRLLNSTIQVKLEQFKQRNELKRFARLSGRLGNANLALRDR
jgi:hypothetical protein